MTKGILGKKWEWHKSYWVWWINSSNSSWSYAKRSFTSKTVETDGYEAIQVGYQDKREVLSNKPAKVMLQKQTRLLSASLKNSRMLS